VADAAEAAKSATVQRGKRERIREIIMKIGKRRICGSGVIDSGEGILPRTA
jgi:hypothetical protein